MGRPLLPRSEIALWCMDSQIFLEVAIQAVREGDVEKGVRAMRCASTCSRLAAERAEGLDPRSKPSR